MTDRERIERLEQLVRDLCVALWDQATGEDGNWGRPSSKSEFRRIGHELDQQPETQG